MSGKIAIVVLSGLPGAGKTTFARKIQTFGFTAASLPAELVTKYKQTTVKPTLRPLPNLTTVEVNNVAGEMIFMHVCYDNIMPHMLHEADVHKNEPKTEKESPWKAYRKQIRYCVEQDIQSLSSQDSLEECNIPATIIAKYKNIKQTRRTFSDLEDNLHIFLIDDNMFFQSMRYEYFQLAKQYKTGFAEIHINCSVEEAQRRNESRETAVLPNTINTMAAKFEQPDPVNHWEAMSLTLDAENCSLHENLWKAWELIVHAASHPVLSEDSNETARSADRVVCSQSVVHQADQIMRKLIGLEMSRLKDVIGTNEQMKVKAAQLNQIRTLLLEEMKTRKLLIPVILENYATNASKDNNNPLYLYVKDIFDKR